MGKKDLITYWEKTGIVKDKRLIKAFESINRENFVSGEYKSRAYEDIPLPIASGQTISQPTTVMIMIEALELQKGDVVLEIGSGSGYNAAIISRLCSFVYSIEIIPELAGLAKKNIKKEGIKNVEIIIGDGSRGYAEKAPYDKIIFTAACPTIPKQAIEQLKEKGIIIAPVGNQYSQKMIKAVKEKQRLNIKELGDFMFVPLKGEYGF